uniref:Cyclic nucleotide-binding domain-containing protein n=1 Tax=Arcella intermedia TaxID=1963864 RepID=A0A6B2KXK5_9EUKA
MDRIRHSYDDLESSEAEYDVTWPRFSEYEESNNSIELESCTKEQLLNLLITPENSPLLAIWDYTSFLMNFLIVYESFFSTEELMHHLVNKYNDVVPTIDGYDIRLRNTLKKLVVEWISVEKAIETKTTVEKLFVDYTKNNHNTFSIDFEKYELRGKSKLYVATEPVDSDVFETETIEPPQKKNYVVLDFNPVEVARQLSLCEASLYNKIPRIEMLNGKIFSKNKELLAPNFVAMVEHSNRICSWIKTEILRLPNPKLRSEAVVFFINVIVGLEQYRNFNSLVSALSALHSSTITKLKKTWELVPKKEKEILDYITDLMSSSHHYKCYRQMLSNVADEYPTIPLLSLVASDIFGIEENIPTYEENTTDYLKWRKTRLMAKVILNFKRFTPVNYPFKEVLPIQNYIANCESWQNDNIAYELASLLEGEELGDKELDYLNTDDLWEKYGPLDRDWSVVLAGSRTVTFEKGSIIIDEGASISHVYRVNVGRVSITRNGEKVGTITEGQIFGETTFIFHRKVESPDRFIAETDVEVQQIPEEFIAHMCKEKPELEARFQIEFARTLAKQLRMISAFRMVPKLQLGNIMEENTAPNKDVNHFNVDVSTSDKKLCKRFGIENEVVLQAFSCDWKKGNKSQGIDGVVYVFQNYICFYSSSFGLQTKDVIPFTSVTDITQGKKDVDINITTTQTSINCSNFQKKMSQIYELLRSVWVAKAQNSDKPIASPDPAIEKPKLMEKKKLAIPNHEDWSLILKGSVMLTFPENHYIIKEGERVCRLYQIQSGSCKVVQRQQPDQVLATINSEDKILGERCFLDGGKATASVITTQPTKVIAIEAYFLNFLLQIKPDLVGRFFHYVSTLLARGYLKKRFLI